MRGNMKSPGHPVAGRDIRVRFWKAIARGLSTEVAAAQTGVSPAVGARWFRHSGGMTPVSLAPLSKRYLSFREREEIVILHAQRVGVRAIARRLGRAPSTISRELCRNASTRTYWLEY
jgi:AraC-like DNA-binding protein